MANARKVFFFFNAGPLALVNGRQGTAGAPHERVPQPINGPEAAFGKAAMVAVPLQRCHFEWRKIRKKKQASKQTQDGGDWQAASPAACVGTSNKFCPFLRRFAAPVLF